MSSPHATSPPGVEVTFNGQLHRLLADGTLADLILQLSIAPQTVATALNGVFVARDRRAATLLRDGDQVTCFQIIVGG